MARKKKVQSTKIEDLPDTDVDPTVESQNLKVLSDILNIKESDNPIEYSRIKFVIFATAIFAMLSLPFSDRLIELSTPIANSWLVLWGIKIVIFFIIYYIVVYSQTKTT